MFTDTPDKRWKEYVTDLRMTKDGITKAFGREVSDAFALLLEMVMDGLPDHVTGSMAQEVFKDGVRGVVLFTAKSFRDRNADKAGQDKADASCKKRWDRMKAVFRKKSSHAFKYGYFLSLAEQGAPLQDIKKCIAQDAAIPAWLRLVIEHDCVRLIDMYEE